MAIAETPTTTVSSEGRITLPSQLRKRRAWKAGTRLTVEETEDGVLLRPMSAFPDTRPEDVFGALPYRGKPKTIAEMDVGVLAEAKRRPFHD